MKRVVLLWVAMVGCGDGVPSSPVEEAAAETPAVPSEAAIDQSTDGSHYGAAFTVNKVTPGSTVLESPAQYVDKTVRLSGTVSDVCQKMGCWMVFSDGSKHMRVTMKDHSFAIDKQASGASCEVEGQVIVKAIDPEVVAHYASEGNEGAPVPENQATDNKSYELVATSVRLTKRP